MALPVVTNAQTTTLAWFAELAYEDSWTSDMLGGWQLVSGSELGIPDTLLSSGHYEYQNGAAMVLEANFNGSDVLLMSFRGSDQDADWVTNISDIDEHFELFAPLTTAAQGALDAGTYDAILVTGHSLGGAMTEVYLHTYADPDVYGISWGSPGIHMDYPVADERLINYVFTDDGIAWLGTQRDDIADEISLWSLGDAASVVDALGISGFSLLAAIKDLDGDYQHQGTTALIAADGSYVGHFDPAITLDNLEPYIDTHDMGRYLLTSLSLNPYPFSLPDSTVAGTALSANETTVLELYDTTFNTLPSGDTFGGYTAYFDAGGNQMAAAAAMLDVSGLRWLPREQFLDTIFTNVLGRDASWQEKHALMWDSHDSAPANVLMKLASGGLEDAAMTPTVGVLGAMATYDFI